MPKIRINGVDLFYVSYGKGTPIIFIPGLGHCHKLWKPQVEALADHYRVILIDLRGAGKSELGTDCHTIKLYAEDIKELMIALQLKKAILCGLSLGSLVAQQFAIDYADMCFGLVLCSTHFHPGLKEKIAGMLVPTALKSYFKKNTMQSFADATSRKVFTKETQAELREFYANEVIASSERGYLESWRAVSQFDSYRLLKNISAPTLIYYGGNDDSFIKRQAALITDHITNAESKMMPTAGHIINLENPDEFNQTVLAFLNKHVSD